MNWTSLSRSCTMRWCVFVVCSVNDDREGGVSLCMHIVTWQMNDRSLSRMTGINCDLILFCCCWSFVVVFFVFFLVLRLIDAATVVHRCHAHIYSHHHRRRCEQKQKERERILWHHQIPDTITQTITHIHTAHKRKTDGCVCVFVVSIDETTWYRVWLFCSASRFCIQVYHSWLLYIL